ncbi:MAG: hypothetical protein WCJ09_19320, partial [Planctomycetota bacterium]
RAQVAYLTKMPQSARWPWAGVLEVIKNNPEQMDNYISRLKYQLDEVSRLESARLEALSEGRTEGKAEGRIEGLKEGENRGELFGQIKVLQEILGVSEPSRDELTTFDMTQLSELCELLRQNLRSRSSN